ncbi:putative glutamate-cysteine ligase protein [Fonsecaea pedrosoi]|nr:putative glutamate-cysteine ligase protein [Fonsecaea pedrosoi]
MYISDDSQLQPVYNSPEIKADPGIKRYLERNSSMDSLLASHYANILTRDPIALTKNELRSYESLDLFEILHSAVWPHVDFKLPSKDGAAGWRVEFRPLEVQLTDFENAAFAVFVTLVARTILHYGLNFYIPIEKVAENMERAHTRNAVREQKFFFRLKVERATLDEEAPGSENPDQEYTSMTMTEIMNGSLSLQNSKGHSFPGLIPLVQSYILEVFESVSGDDRRTIDKYLDIIRKRATGEMLTPASWMRQFVQGHQDYHQDSFVSELVCYDLMKVVKALGDGRIDPAELFLCGHVTKDHV